MAEERRVNLSTELSDLRASFDHLAEAISTNFDEERLREAIASDQRRDRRQERHRNVAAIIVIIVVGLAAFFQSRDNGQNLEKSTIVANYVENCLIAPNADPVVREKQCGPKNDGTASAVKVLFCVLLEEPQARKPADLQACADRVQAGEFG